VDNVADFAITQIRFNPVGSYIACSSVANSVSYIRLEQDLGKVKTTLDLLEDNVLYIIGVLCLLAATLYLRFIKQG
jgi:hypothetical protein